MRNKILALEKQALPLEPNLTTRHIWTQAVNKYADDFINDIETTKAWNETKAKGEGILELPITDAPRSIEEIMSVIEEHVDGPALNPASGGHLAYIPGGGIFPTALGDYLADITNRYAGIFFASPGAVRIENLLIRWMCKMVGFPKSALGNLTSGGSIATLIAITTARDAKEIRARDIEHTVIYITEQAHHSVQKAIRIAGMGEAKLSYIPITDKFKMNAEILAERIEADKAAGLRPFMVVASAGTTDTGVIDPLEAIADLSAAYEMWLHVDAAYGGFFMLTEEVRANFKGIERADSVTIDPHKGLFLAYGTGAILIKNVEALQNTHYYLANYMQDVVKAVDEPSPADLSPELTKHFRGMRMWLPLQLFGVSPFKAALSEKLWLCRYFHQEVQKIGFEVGPEPELSVMIYRYVPPTGDANEFNAKIVEAVRIDGRVYLSSTTINGVFWIRLAVLSFRSHLKTIDLCLEVLKNSVRKLIQAPVI